MTTTEMPIYSQKFVDTLNDEVNYWKRQCYELRVQLRDAKFGGQK